MADIVCPKCGGSSLDVEKNIGGEVVTFTRPIVSSVSNLGDSQHSCPCCGHNWAVKGPRQAVPAAPAAPASIPASPATATEE